MHRHGEVNGEGLADLERQVFAHHLGEAGLYRRDLVMAGLQEGRIVNADVIRLGRAIDAGIGIVDGHGAAGNDARLRIGQCAGDEARSGGIRPRGGAQDSSGEEKTTETDFMMTPEKSYIGRYKGRKPRAAIKDLYRFDKLTMTR